MSQPFTPTPNKDKDNQKELNTEKLLSKFINFFLVSHLYHWFNTKNKNKENKIEITEIYSIFTYL